MRSERKSRFRLTEIKRVLWFMELLKMVRIDTVLHHHRHLSSFYSLRMCAFSMEIARGFFSLSSCIVLPWQWATNPPKQSSRGDNIKLYQYKKWGKWLNVPHVCVRVTRSYCFTHVVCIIGLSFLLERITFAFLGFMSIHHLNKWNLF